MSLKLPRDFIHFFNLQEIVPLVIPPSCIVLSTYSSTSAMYSRDVLQFDGDTKQRGHAISESASHTSTSTSNEQVL